MKKERLLHLLCSLLIMIMVIGSVSFGEESPRKFFQYDISLNDYYSLPIHIKDNSLQEGLDSNYFLKGEVVILKNYYDTSALDPNYPGVLIESSYKINDIVEINNRLYIMAVKTYKVKDIYNKTQYEKISKDYSMLNVDLKILPSNNQALTEIFKTNGIVASLDKETNPVEVYYDSELGLYPVYGFEFSKVFVESYKTEIGNIVAGKYTVNKDKVAETNPSIYNHFRDQLMLIPEDYPSHRDNPDQLSLSIVPSQIADKLVRDMGIRISFVGSGLHASTLPSYDQSVYTQKLETSPLINNYGDRNNYFSKKHNYNGTIVNSDTTYNPIFNPISPIGKIKYTFDNLNDQQLQEIGIETQPRVTEKNVKTENFSDLFSGAYITNSRVYRISKETDHYFNSDYMDLDIPEKDAINFFGNSFIETKVVDSNNSRTLYLLTDGIVIESYPWGFLARDSKNKNLETVFYKIPKFEKYEWNPFTHPEYFSRVNHISYWDMSNYYKGEIKYVSNDKKVETIVSYKLLEGNENFSSDSKVVNHKARNLTDNSIRDIEILFEFVRIMPILK